MSWRSARGRRVIVPTFVFLSILLGLVFGCDGNSVEDQIRKTVVSGDRQATIEAGVAATLRARSSPTVDELLPVVRGTFTAEARARTVVAMVQQTRYAGATATRNAIPTPTRCPGVCRDQVTCAPKSPQTVAVRGETWKAQTFVPGFNGRLVRVELKGSTQSSRPVLAIRNTERNVPGIVDLASAPIAADNTADFGDGVRLEGGVLYALVVSNEDGTYNWDYSTSPLCYSNPLGTPFTSWDHGESWTNDIVDFYFATYMAP